MKIHFPHTREQLPFLGVDMENCWHGSVTLDDESRTVTCDICGKALDSFAYLMMLMKDWHSQSYRDNLAKQAYAALKQQELNAMARGHFFSRPNSPSGKKAWDAFEEYLGHEPFSVFRRGNSWYLQEEDGSGAHEDYARFVLRKRELDSAD